MWREYCENIQENKLQIREMNFEKEPDILNSRDVR